MTGNTWDWTSSRYMDYPYNAADGREEPVTPGGLRVVRGGSWDNSQVLARAATRYDYAPGARINYLGLRVARSSPSLA